MGIRQKTKACPNDGISKLDLISGLVQSGGYKDKSKNQKSFNGKGRTAHDAWKKNRNPFISKTGHVRFAQKTKRLRDKDKLGSSQAL